MTHSTRYRMYVDESGDDVMDPSKWRNPDARYLGLTGVVIASETYRTRTHPEFEALKQEFFPHNPYEPLVLVRQKIVQKRDEFRILEDREIADRWEEAILRILESHISQVITVVLDKSEYLQRGLVNSQRPYGYCVSVLTDLYGQWLNNIGGTGDVMAESRGKKEDQEVKDDFHRYMRGDTNPREGILTHGGTQEARLPISSNHIKLNLKLRNIAGLQLADLLAYPSRKGFLVENERVPGDSPSNATDRFYELIKSKSYATRLLLP